MYKKVIFLLCFFTGLTSVYATGEGDSTKVKTEKKFEKSISEKTDPSIKQRRGRRDFFIDKDGDGICDNRAKGMSFERQRKRQNSNSGGHGNGNQGGNK